MENEERTRRSEQALSYLGMVKEKIELRDNEAEKYWRERTLERLDKAFIGPAGWNSSIDSLCFS